MLISKGTILQAGDSDGTGLAVTFNVRDNVSNYAEDWCRETRIVVSTNTSLLLAPIVKEAQNNVLDLDALGDNPVTLQVWALGKPFELNDVIAVKARGTTLDGDSVEITAPTQIIDNLPHTYEFSLPAEDVRKLVKSQVIFSFEVRRAGSPDPLRSKGQFVQVVGEATRLAAPIAEDEQQGSLDPDLPNTRIRIPFDPLIEVDTAIELKWFGTRPNGSTYDPDLGWFSPDRDEAANPNGFLITVEGKHLKTLEGGRLDLSYNLLRDEDGDIVKRGSRQAAVLNVGEPQLELVKPIVLGETEGALEPDDLPNGTSRLTAPRPTENPSKSGDIVTYTWIGEVSGRTEDSITLNALTANRDVNFTLNAAFVATHIEPNRGQKVTASYRILRKETGKNSYSDPLTFLIGEAQEFKLPVATFKEATGAGNDQLNPDDVFPLGATVVIAQTALLKTDDDITVTVQGINSTTYSHRVLSTEADKELSAIKVPHSVIADNEGLSINLSYSIKRAAGGTDGPADPTVYDVRKVIVSGNLKVMGARYCRSHYRASRASQVLSAFNKTTGQPVQAQWKYPGDSNWTTAAIWRDSKPQEPLQVRSGDDQFTLNPANIIGNGIETESLGEAAFVAHRDVGDVVAWGNDSYGAKIPANIITMDDIVEVSCTRSAFAARREHGEVVAWGDPAEGGSMTGVAPLDFVQVVGNLRAFAGIKTTGQVVAWGVADDGGTVPAPISELNDVVKVVATRSAFAIQRATGHVRAWGLAAEGGTVPANIAGFTDIKTILAGRHAFAAHRANGRIVAWGHASYGGIVPDDIAAMTDIIELSCANGSAFTARRATGQVIAWGDAESGGTIDPLIGRLTDIVEVSANFGAFAARRGNGRVVAWGWPLAGGTLPDDIAGLDDIVQVCGSSQAFAALRKNGTVVAWGDTRVGGDTSTVVDQLTDVQALYSNTQGFTALTSDGRVVTWGHKKGGGDSSAVQDRLRGKVSYVANPVSRGLALKASRLAALDVSPNIQAR
ncbi:RCC1 domain-containing protein [Pseudomonas sp. 18173]|uniref:RCC1 domain-containing protein n=1 Tax=Pseudomonas sp. 18173 TaxID=3390055 RepID=UPI003D20E2F7